MNYFETLQEKNKQFLNEIIKYSESFFNPYDSNESYSDYMKSFMDILNKNNPFPGTFKYGNRFESDMLCFEGNMFYLELDSNFNGKNINILDFGAEGEDISLVSMAVKKQTNNTVSTFFLGDSFNSVLIKEDASHVFLFLVNEEYEDFILVDEEYKGFDCSLTNSPVITQLAFDLDLLAKHDVKTLYNVLFEKQPFQTTETLDLLCISSDKTLHNKDFSSYAISVNNIEKINHTYKNKLKP